MNSLILSVLALVCFIFAYTQKSDMIATWGVILWVGFMVIDAAGGDK